MRRRDGELRDSDRMTGSELWVAREHLGLARADLARLLSVREDTVRRWEIGKDPIPFGVSPSMVELADATTSAVGRLSADLRAMPVPFVQTFREHEAVPAEREDVVRFGVRWWRQVVARAAVEVPGTRIGTYEELVSLGLLTAPDHGER